MGRGVARFQRSNFHPHSGQIVEHLLRRSLVKCSRRNLEAKIFVECDAAGGVGDTDRGVIDSKKGVARLLSPNRWHIVVGEGEKFQGMPLRIAEFEGGDTPDDSGSRCGPVREIEVDPPTVNSR